jgi:hypothetical protein
MPIAALAAVAVMIASHATRHHNQQDSDLEPEDSFEAEITNRHEWAIQNGNFNTDFEIAEKDVPWIEQQQRLKEIMPWNDNSKTNQNKEKVNHEKTNLSKYR